jgi:phenylacetate-CoA ligase
MSNLQDLVACNAIRKNLMLYTTGGSTGEPTCFWVSKLDRSWGTAAMLRSNFWCNDYRLGDPMALIWASHIDLVESTNVKKKVMNLFMRRDVLNAYHLSERSLLSFTKRLGKLEPKVIRGYSSAVYLLACFVEREGAMIRPEGVITTAEMLLPHQRSKIEKVFGCKVYDSYGSREFEEIASECSEHSGYHIAAENLVLEFVKDGEHVSPDETGEILVTDLRSYAMPFIRYSIGDLGKPSNETCSCGRGLPLMRSVEGRLADIIVGPNSYLSVFDAPLCDMVQIKQYQIVQEEINKIVIRIVKGLSYSEEDTQQIVDAIKQYLGESVKISIEFVSFIPNAKSGKRRFVISKVKTPFETTEVQNQN